MCNATEENHQATADTAADKPNEGHAQSCPSWCDLPGECRGEHYGKAHGTVATGGLPPVVDGPEAPRHDTAAVRAQYPEASELPHGVALFGVWACRDWQVDLTVKEAHRLLEGLTAAIAEAESD